MLEPTVWNLSRADEQPEDVRAAIYARTSSVTQGFGYSLQEQVRLCLERCEMCRWRPVFVFQDAGASGGDTDRPEFQLLMNRAKRRLFDVLVVWKLDRFSRSLLHVVQLEQRLREYDVALHSVTEQIDTTTSAGRFNFRSIANAAEFERDMIRDRSRMGLYAMAADSRWPNRNPPLGYDIDDNGRLVINEMEAKSVRDLFERYLDRKSMPEVAYELNQAGVQTKRGNKWCPRAVGDVLRNRIYIGEYSVAGISKELPECRIITDEVFKRTTDMRMRFQSKEAERRKMPVERKKAHVNRIIEQYQRYRRLKSTSGDRL